MQIADVYINIPVKSIAQAFSYRVPESLEKLSAGWRVLVPFAGRDIEGFIVCVYPAEKRQEHGCSYPVEKLKYIKAAVDDEPWFSPLMIEASRWLADFYLCSAGEMMRLFMPGKSGLKIQMQYEAVPDMQDNIEAVLSIMQFIYDNIMYAELNSKSDYCQVCDYDGEIKIVRDETGKLVWECPKCGNRDQNKMHVARRTCGYIGLNDWNQGRTQEIKERYVHLGGDE